MRWIIASLVLLLAGCSGTDVPDSGRQTEASPTVIEETDAAPEPEEPDVVRSFHNASLSFACQTRAIVVMGASQYCIEDALAPSHAFELSLDEEIRAIVVEILTRPDIAFRVSAWQGNHGSQLADGWGESYHRAQFSTPLPSRTGDPDGFERLRIDIGTAPDVEEAGLIDIGHTSNGAADVVMSVFRGGVPSGLSTYCALCGS